MFAVDTYIRLNPDDLLCRLLSLNPAKSRGHHEVRPGTRRDEARIILTNSGKVILRNEKETMGIRRHFGLISGCTPCLEVEGGEAIFRDMQRSESGHFLE